MLKNNGYNLAHNFGHGKKYLARTFAAMNLLAFAFHTACDAWKPSGKQARQGCRSACTITFRTYTPSLPTSCSLHGTAS